MKENEVNREKSKMDEKVIPRQVLGTPQLKILIKAHQHMAIDR